ncbi:MAG: GntP family permease [Tannerella sp.]|jgi:Gnt-I system high-affinity gluconate transporter|nr:GntP family permease [Tannerella sp.]
MIDFKKNTFFASNKKICVNFMSPVIIIVIISLIALILLVSWLKVDAFLAFLLVSIGAGIVLGIPLEQVPKTVETGLGSILGSLTMIIVLGVMLGKIVAESGAAHQIATVMTGLFSTNRIQWGLMITGFIVGIPLFHSVGFVLLVPLLFSIANRYKLSAVYIGFPMITALSVTHGFLPPHPSPVALVALFNADLGMTMVWGFTLAIPIIILGGPLFSQTFKKLHPGPVTLFEQKEHDPRYKTPGIGNSLLTATLPVILLMTATALTSFMSDVSPMVKNLLAFFGNPSIVMLISVIIATFTLGLRQGRKIRDTMTVYVDAIKDIAPILLIISGSGVFKQVMEDGGVNVELAAIFNQSTLHPLVLGWLIAAIIRLSIGSATVAALTAANFILPVMASHPDVDPNLMVISLGAGSLFFSHVNDSGFWLFKEYFNLSLKDTFRSWSTMETIVSVAGLVGVLIINIFI